MWEAYCGVSFLRGNRGEGAGDWLVGWVAVYFFGSMDTQSMDGESRGAL